MQNCLAENDENKANNTDCEWWGSGGNPSLPLPSRKCRCSRASYANHCYQDNVHRFVEQKNHNTFLFMQLAYIYLGVVQNACMFMGMLNLI